MIVFVSAQWTEQNCAAFTYQEGVNENKVSKMLIYSMVSLRIESLAS